MLVRWFLDFDDIDEPGSINQKEINPAGLVGPAVIDGAFLERTNVAREKEKDYLEDFILPLFLTIGRRMLQHLLHLFDEITELV